VPLEHRAIQSRRSLIDEGASGGMEAAPQ